VAGLVGGLDRDFGTYAERLVLPAADVGLVPDGLDLVAASTLPLNALTAAQLVDLLGDGDGRSLLVTGAAGAVGGYVVPLAAERGWRVTGLGRATDEDFVRGLGADFTAEARPGWDAVADAAVVQDAGVALVRDGGLFVGVQPSAPPASARGVEVRVVGVVPDGARTTALLAEAAAGRLVTRVAGELPLAEAAEAQRIVGKGGVRGRWVLRP
jgi:NADPH:quinone reductase-like Zn-dependent oxidoreductase